jgi:thiamine kinase-like enzyme
MELWRRFHEAWPEFFQRYRSTLPPDALAVAARFAEAMPDLTVRWAESDVGCIIHGDARMDNLLAGKRGDVRLIDWQTASRGNGAFDLAHFIAGSLTVEDRRQYEVELLQLYLRSLQSHGIGSIDYESLSRDVRKTLLLVLPLNVIFGAGDPPDAHADRSRRAVLGRYFTALSEWGSGNFLT